MSQDCGAVKLNAKYLLYDHVSEMAQYISNVDSIARRKGSIPAPPFVAVSAHIATTKPEF